MHYYLLILKLLFSFFFVSGQQLIPKKELFSQERLNKVGYWSNKDLLIYGSTTRKNKLFLFDIASKKTDSITFSNNVVSYLVNVDGIIALTRDNVRNCLEHFNVKNKAVTIVNHDPDVQPLKLVEQSKKNQNRFVVSVYDDKTEGSYYSVAHFENDSITFSAIKNKEGFKNLYFDNSLNPIGASKPNDVGGISLYSKSKDSGWVEISKNRWDVSAFLGEFQKILSISSEGEEIYFLDNLTSDKNQLKLYNRLNGKIEVLAESDIGDLLPFGFSKDENNRISSVVTLFDKTYRYYTNDKTKADFEFIQGILDTNIGFVDSDSENSKWVIRTLDGKPSDYFTFNRKTKKLTYLFNEFPGLKKYRFSKRNGFIITTKDSLKLPVHVYLPPDSDKNGDGIPDKPLPTIMYSHGGPWVGVIHWNGYGFWRNYQLLANRGYAVVVMEFRGSSGYGKDFVDKSNYQWGKKMLDDKIHITQWAINNKIAQPDKIAIWGWSYGGYAVLSALAFRPNVFACGISMYPPTDLSAFMELPQYGETNLWNNRLANSKTEEGRKLLFDISPINHIGEIKKPIILSTGMMDKLVPFEHVNAFADAMRAKEKEFSYLVYKDEGHDYINQNTWLTFWNAGEELLKNQLGGKAEFTRIPEDYNNLVIEYNSLGLKIK